MTKAFDISDLEAKLKAQGLPAVEGLAAQVATQFFLWLSQSMSLEASTNPLFSVGVPLLAVIQPLVMAEIQKISPVVAPTA